MSIRWETLGPKASTNRLIDLSGGQIDAPMSVNGSDDV